MKRLALAPAVLLALLAAEETARPAAALAAMPSPDSEAFACGETDGKPFVTLQLDLQRSVIRWKGTKFRGLGKHEGIVRLASGSVAVDGRAPVGGSFVVDMRSIEVTDIPPSDPVPRRRLREHLMHDDFFAVARHPTATFQIRGVSPRPGGRYLVDGALTLRGQTRPVRFEAGVAPAANGALHATARFRINRQHWGVAYRGSRLTNDLVDDPIELTLDLVTAPAPPARVAQGRRSAP
ncbi:MAG TPA: YceI family protein [Longimicrobium sp.]|nr:YceI family protein [Longimicrobium sp.]